MSALTRTCNRLSEAATRKHPSKIFNSKVSECFACIFGFGRRPHPAERIRYILNELVREAAQLIENAFEVRDETAMDGRILTYRRARCAGATDAFSYMALDESEVPWEEDKTFSEEEANSETVSVDDTPASNAFLEVPGLLKEQDCKSS